MRNPIPEKYRPTVKDIAERAVKTFAGGFIIGANLPGAAVNVAISDIDWVAGIDFGAGTLVVSLLFSAASLKRGNPGTASLTSAVSLSERGE